MKYYIISGEASGDLHGSNLMRELKKQDADANFRCWGGDLMQDQGGDIVKHYRDLAFMGFAEVILNLRTIFKNISFCKADILSFQPDVLILIDYPGFNLRIAKFAKAAGIKVFYYISPQIWAWKQSRVHGIKKNVDEMFVILPFEKAFYARFDMDVHFVGHPLLDAIAHFGTDSLAGFRTANGLDDKPIVALLPGSRKQEIKKMLPIMLSAAARFPEYQFVIAGAKSITAEFYAELIGNNPIKVLKSKTYPLLRSAHAAMVTSGTATLETALFGVPEVVCYKGGQISYQIARRLIKVGYISLVNLIMDRIVVKELIQAEFNADTLEEELRAISEDGPYRTKMLADYGKLKADLGGEGASKNTATLMLKTLRQA